MIELEKTFLAKSLPDLKGCKSIEIIDMYIPKAAAHPKLRIRRYGNRFEITKKLPVGEDASTQEEQTISLTKEEFTALMKLGGKKARKTRHFYSYMGRNITIDIFRDKLEGLVLVDAEFGNEREMNKFTAPDFCLAEVTQEKTLAGGMLCGKSYKDMEPTLRRYGYKKLSVNKTSNSQAVRTP